MLFYERLEMLTYTKDEIISSSSVARNFGDILNKLSKGKLEKVAVIRNNKIEAILIPVEAFENMHDKLELTEHIELYKMIKEREKNSKRVDFEAIIAETGISLDEL